MINKANALEDLLQVENCLGLRSFWPDWPNWDLTNFQFDQPSLARSTTFQLKRVRVYKLLCQVLLGHRSRPGSKGCARWSAAWQSLPQSRIFINAVSFRGREVFPGSGWTFGRKLLRGRCLGRRWKVFWLWAVPTFYRVKHLPSPTSCHTLFVHNCIQFI